MRLICEMRMILRLRCIQHHESTRTKPNTSSKHATPASSAPSQIPQTKSRLWPKPSPSKHSPTHPENKNTPQVAPASTSPTHHPLTPPAKASPSSIHPAQRVPPRASSTTAAARRAASSPASPNHPCHPKDRPICITCPSTGPAGL